MTIRFKLIGAFVLMLAFLFLNSALLVMVANGSSSSFDEIGEASDHIDNDILPLITLTQELRVHVVQVQQWLTDISATRGLDGLNDGFDEAEGHAKAFATKVDQAITLAKGLQNEVMVQSFEQMKKDFTPYYEVGKQMATAYIAEGPAGGNKMMGNFDEVAAKIQQAVAVVEEKVKTYVTSTLKDGHDILDKGKASNEKMRNIAFVPIGVSILVGIGAIVGVVGICRNVNQMTNTMHELSHGNLDSPVHGLGRKDELGDMAGSVEIFKGNAQKNKQLEEERRLAEERANIERRDALLGLADDLDERVSGSMQKIAGVLTNLENMAAHMSAAADQTSAQSQAVSAATEETSVNMEAVSASGSQLTASINEISKQVSQSSTIANEAVSEAQQTTQAITSLAGEVGQIENVVKLITDIAEQTNLLALNATIEAARAGDAGKGFAVVASEVKNLAQQTATATEEISTQINKIQSQTTGAVNAIDGIGKTIANLNDYSSSIAAAVEEQSAATGEISHNVNEAAKGTEEVSSNITGVAQAATETGKLARDVADAAHQVKDASQDLRTKVQEFLDDVRDGSSGKIRY